jgi:predicted Zn-dependent protease
VKGTFIAAPRVPLPASAFDASRGQYLSSAILAVLAAAKRPEWERLLGIADVDLYVADLNFVFGEGDARRGVAIFFRSRGYTTPTKNWSPGVPRPRRSTSLATPMLLPTARGPTA